MNYHLIFRMSLRAVGHHKGRSLLTVLGIVIGIAGIIATTAIGRGAQKKARDQMLAYGSKSMFIRFGNFAAKNVVKPPVPLTVDDLEIIRRLCNKVEYASPTMYADDVVVERAGQQFSTDISCVDENVLYIDELTLEQGLFFNQGHVMRKENVVVLNHEAGQAIFPWGGAVGATIRLNKIPFVVVGVLAEQKVKQRWDLGKLKMLIPFTVGKRYFDYGRGSSVLGGITLSTFDEKDNPSVMQQITTILRASHHLEENDPDDFMIFDTQMMAEAAEAGSKVIALFALIAASIALLVGGIGVMNIMLVAVQERTREIGIKLALGATGTIIQLQFLIEAVVLSVSGGLLGVAVGIGISYLLGHFTQLPAIVEIPPIIISFLMTVMIGLFFGFYPARKASLFDPVEALVEH
jgi:putative ABC transport system permease protein